MRKIISIILGIAVFLQFFQAPGVRAAAADSNIRLRVGQYCGNGVIEGAEQCDDDNNIGGDGCSAACVIEYCGDGAVNNNGTEECDDGNSSSDDGCSAACVIEYCGDGIDNNGVEECDDGNTVGGDGCSAACVIEYCGDAIVNNGEVCDNNTQPCTAGGYSGIQLCNASCNGWQACIPSEFCGDGITNGPEACDDGNAIDCDGCRSDCTRPDNVCGDGYLECDEVCDSTLGVPAGYRCTGACSLERLGYGSILPDFFVGVEIFNIQKRVDRFSAAITWDTNKDAACSFEWGQTAGYFTNIANEIEYKKTHVVQVIDLIPATTYFYGIECHDGWDHQARTPIYQFTTESLEDNTAPANVSNFKAEAATDAIILSWKNPEDADLAGVKIVRSDKFFVKSPTAGTVIFNGSGTRAIDRDAAAGKRYYYTAFAYDKNGNYSSGSLATALILAASQPGTVTKEKPPATKQPWDKQEEQPSDKPFQPQQPEESQDPQRPFPEPQEPGQQPDWETPTSTKEIIITGFPFDALEFYAALGSLRIEVGENEVSFYSGTEFNVKLSKDALDPDVKSLIFSLKRPESGEGDYQNYYFEETQAGRKFELKAMVPDDIGVYDITVSALDTANNVIERTEGKMNVIDRSIITSVVNYKTNLPVPIGGVRVTLYSFDNGEIYKWDASKYLQFNPIYTDDAGSYGFYVPNGKYIVKSEKDHFYKYASLPITVENNLIKQDIELVYIPDINIWIFVLYSAVLIACYLLLRRIVLLIAYQHREKLKTPEGPLHM